jgi:hypothetical protein
MKAVLTLLLTSLLLTAGCSQPTAEAPAGADLPLVALLSTNRVHLGDQVEVQLRVAHPPGTTVDWPRLGDGKSIVVRDQGFAPADSTGSEARWTLASYELGQHAIWSGTVALVQADGTRSNVALPELTLSVESILPDAGEELREPKGLAVWPRAPMTRLLMVLALIALLAALIALLVLWLVRRRARPTPSPAPPPPHEKALKALAELEQRTDFVTVEPELFFVDLSTIARHYLEDRFELRAPEQTTEEFIRVASSSNHLRMEHQQLVGDFLTECDLVKFARHRPGIERMKLALAAAYRLVRETIPVPVGSPPGGAA